MRPCSAARRSLGGVLILALLATGCAGLDVRHTREVPAGLPPRVELAQVPFHPQEAYQCGPAALAMVLNWSGEPAKPEDLTPITYTAARQGSLQADILSAARRHGRLAYPVSTLEHLLAEVAAGHPVLVLQNLGLSWIPRWHYAVVVGYELGRGQVILRSGLERREVLPLGLFTRTWARGGNWGIVVLAPGTLPARPAETPYLQAAIGLEQARQWRAAVRAYSAALVPWPGSLGALIGLGNSHYALGELSQAQAALREATRLHPQSGAAWNNLAVVLAKQRRYREARAAAQHAVTLGGALSEEYRKTLIEIEKAGSQG